MRPGVLTIRRQIAKRRRSEIIRNLQLTGVAAVMRADDGRGGDQGPHRRGIEALSGRLMATVQTGWAESIETISAGYLARGSCQETTAPSHKRL